MKEFAGALMAGGTAGGPAAPRALSRAPAALRARAAPPLRCSPGLGGEPGPCSPGTVLFMGTSEGLQGSTALVPGTSME